MLSEKPLVDWRDEFFALRDQIDPNDPEVEAYMRERPLNVNFDLSRVLHEDNE